jgi:hypothetical protein
VLSNILCFVVMNRNYAWRWCAKNLASVAVASQKNGLVRLHQHLWQKRLASGCTETCRCHQRRRRFHRERCRPRSVVSSPRIHQIVSCETPLTLFCYQQNPIVKKLYILSFHLYCRVELETKNVEQQLLRLPRRWCKRILCIRSSRTTQTLLRLC